jgi:hypothetical protein
MTGLQNVHSYATEKCLATGSTGKVHRNRKELILPPGALKIAFLTLKYSAGALYTKVSQAEFRGTSGFHRTW